MIFITISIIIYPASFLLAFRAYSHITQFIIYIWYVIKSNIICYYLPCVLSIHIIHYYFCAYAWHASHISRLQTIILIFLSLNRFMNCLYSQHPIWSIHKLTDPNYWYENDFPDHTKKGYLYRIGKIVCYHMFCFETLHNYFSFLYSILCKKLSYVYMYWISSAWITQVFTNVDGTLIISM